MSDLGNSKSDELLTMLEEMQNQIEALQKRKLEKQQEISKLLSENSILKKELQRKSEMIVSLNEKIVMLNESDIILEQNKQLEKKNQELQSNARQMMVVAETMVKNAKEEYSKKESQILKKMQDVQEKESNVDEIIREYKDGIDKRFEEKVKVKVMIVYGITIGLFIYSFYVTILSVFKSSRASKDFVSFFKAVGWIISSIFQLAYAMIGNAWTVKNLIPYKGLDVVVAVALIIVVITLIIGTLSGMAFVVYHMGKFYMREFGDIFSLVVALGSLTILIWFADSLSWITWNLVLTWVVIHIAYVVIRMMTAQLW